MPENLKGLHGVRGKLNCWIAPMAGWICLPDTIFPHLHQIFVIREFLALWKKNVAANMGPQLGLPAQHAKASCVNKGL